MNKGMISMILHSFLNGFYFLIFICNMKPALVGHPSSK